MIISVEELKQYITTTLDDSKLEVKLKALEVSIRKYTNNNFQKRGYRRTADVIGGLFICDGMTPFRVGETVMISSPALNEGLYTVSEVDDYTFRVNEDVVDEKNALVTKVEYPADVIEGAINIMKWKLKNEAANDGDKSKKDIQSETISRHSVTYATDATETDIDERFGVPKKHTAFLKHYKKARF